MRFFQADHLRDIIIFILVLVIISLIFSFGFFVGKDKSQSTQNQITGLNSSTQDDMQRKEIDKDKLVGDDKKDCKASGGTWTLSPICGSYFTCESRYQERINPVWGDCLINEKKIEHCECGGSFCWDGESCVDFQNYMDNKK